METTIMTTQQNSQGTPDPFAKWICDNEYEFNGRYWHLYHESPALTTEELFTQYKKENL